jgi:hypothetical protein
MSLAITAPAILKIGPGLPSLAPQLRRFLARELLYRGERRCIRSWSDIIEASCAIAGTPVDVQVPAAARAIEAKCRGTPAVILQFDDAGLLTLARAIAISAYGIPITVLASTNDDLTALDRSRSILFIPTEGAAEWTAGLRAFSPRAMAHPADPAVLDLVIASPFSPVRLRLVSGAPISVGLDDEYEISDTDLRPLPTENLRSLAALAIQKGWPDPFVQMHAPPDTTLSQLGQGAISVGFVFGTAILLKSEKPVADFVAALPDPVHAYFTTLTADAGLKRVLDRAPIDVLWRALLLIANATLDDVAVITQAMTTVPFAKAALAATVTSCLTDYGLSPVRLFDGKISEEQDARNAFDRFRSSIVARMPIRPAIAELIQFIRRAWIRRAPPPLRAATIRSLMDVRALPDLNQIALLDACHRTFPKAPRLSFSDVERFAEALNELELSFPSHDATLPPLFEALAPHFRSEATGLSTSEACDLADFINWAVDWIRVLASTNPVPHDIIADDARRNAAFSILLAPAMTTERLRAVSRRWHDAIDRFETETYDFEAGCEAFRDLLPNDAFPHFLRGPATVSFGGVNATVTPLVSNEALLEEGAEMHHCVGTFRCAAARGYSLIVSIKSADARSTAEYRATDKGYAVINHRTFNNEEPTPLHREIAASLERVALEAPYARAQHPRLLAMSKIEHGWPWNFMTAAELADYRGIAFRQLATFLTPSERKMTWQDWVATMLPLHEQRFGGDNFSLPDPPVPASFISLFRRFSTAVLD